MPALPPLAAVLRRAAVPVLLAGLAGCHKATPMPSETAAEPAAKPSATASALASDAKGFQVSVDASGRKWLTPKIPYDVFPDVPSDAEAIAAGRAAAVKAPPKVGGTDAMVASTAGETPVPVEPPPAETPEAKPAAPPPSASGGSGANWDQVLPAEDLQKEIAAVRNDLTEKLRTVGSYNAAFEAVGRDGWLMSALATIAKEHPAPISWKGNALLARDASVALANAATARGRQNFNDAQLASEHVAAVLNNNTPPGLPTPDPAASREETADRAALMARMQAAFDTLKEDSGDLKKNADTAAHEARLLAALAKFTSHKDYSSAGEPEYQAAANELISAGGAMAEAVAAEDKTGFQAALDRVGTACNHCHAKYRFEK
jgi:hypothetical protein